MLEKDHATLHSEKISCKPDARSWGKFSGLEASQKGWWAGAV